MSTDRLADLAGSPLFIIALIVVATPLTLLVLRALTRARRRLVRIRAAELERVGAPDVSMVLAADIADYREFAVGATLMDLSQRGAIELSYRRETGMDGRHESIPHVRETGPGDPPVCAEERRLLEMIFGASALEQMLQRYLRVRPMTQWRAFRLRRDVDATIRAAGYRGVLPLSLRLGAVGVAIASTATVALLLATGDVEVWMVAFVGLSVTTLVLAHLASAARPLTAEGKGVREQVEAATAHGRVACPDLEEAPIDVRGTQVLAWAALCGKDEQASIAFTRFFGRRPILLSSGAFDHWWWVPGSGKALTTAPRIVEPHSGARQSA